MEALVFKKHRIHLACERVESMVEIKQKWFQLRLCTTMIIIVRGLMVTVL